MLLFGLDYCDKDGHIFNAACRETLLDNMVEWAFMTELVSGYHLRIQMV